MNEFEVVGGPLTNIKVGAQGILEIIQNVQVILGTTVGEVILDRDFGIAADIVDAPMIAAQQRLRAEVVEKVEFFESRVKVTRVEFVNPGLDAAADGKLIPKVFIRIRDGVLL